MSAIRTTEESPGVGAGRVYRALLIGLLVGAAVGTVEPVAARAQQTEDLRHRAEQVRGQLFSDQKIFQWLR